MKRSMEFRGKTLYFGFDNRALIDLGRKMETSGPVELYQKMRAIFQSYTGDEAGVRFEHLEFFGWLIYFSTRAGARLNNVEFDLTEDDALDLSSNVEAYSIIADVVFGTAPNDEDVTPKEEASEDEKKNEPPKVKPGT